MYFRILKKDLKRNRAMNIILLVFVLLSAMFVSSSANNILSVMTARDEFFEMSGISDYFIMTKGTDPEDVRKSVASLKNTDSYQTETLIFLNEDDVTCDGERLDLSSTLGVFSFEDSAMTYFTDDNQAIESMEQGTILLPCKLKDDNGIQIGDTVIMTIGEVSADFRVAGFIKDALFGSPNVAITRCLITKVDFEPIYSEPLIEEQLRNGCLCSVKTDDTKALASEVMDTGMSTVISADRNMIASVYILDMAVAGVLLIVSICLVLIAIVVLRFTINFTVSQEFREIGVMKATGIPSRKIKGLYLVKYFSVSVLGAVLGFAASIPFGNMMLNSVSQTMVIEGSTLYFVNAACAVLVVITVIIFCWGGTKKVDELSPIAAVRDGSQGERFSKKSPLSLTKSRIRPIPFLALNDILTNAKRFITMIIAFTLCLVMTTVVINAMNTLKSEKLVSYFCAAESDVYLVCTSYVDYFEENGRENFKRDLEDMEQVLREENMSGSCCGEILFFCTVSSDTASYGGLLLQGTGTTADQYVYSEGTPPQNANEIAVTSTVADALGVTIGDTVTYTDMGEEKEAIITAFFQSMMNMGNGVRLHEDAEINYSQAAGFNSYQITFDDNPDAEEIEKRMERLAEIYPKYEVMNGGEYVDYFAGSADMVKSIRNILVPVMVIICALIAVLIERSFIAKEVGQIAMLRATGFTRGMIVHWHTLRMAMVLFVSTILGLLLSTPATQLLITPIFRMMGADSIQYEIVPLEAFVIYPGILIGATLVAVYLTAQGTRKITASQTSSIE